MFSTTVGIVAKCFARSVLLKFPLFHNMAQKGKYGSVIHAFTRSIHQQGKKAFYIAQLLSLAISQLVISHQLLLQVANNHLRDLREQGRCSGESACLPPMCPRFNSRTRCHVWVEFVVGSLLCSKRFFFGYPSFPLFLKTNISKFQFDLGMHGHF